MKMPLPKETNSPDLIFAPTAMPWTRVVTADLLEWTGPYTYPMSLPKAPAFFPYNPLGDTRKNSGIPHTLLCAKLRTPSVTQLPVDVREQLSAHSIPIENVDCFVSIQDRPWTKSPLCLRPHPWVHPDAPNTAPTIQGHKGDTFNVTTPVYVGVAKCGAPFGPLVNQSAVSHGSSGHGVVYSPNNMVLMDLTNHSVTNNLYSVCVDPNTKRAAVTLHALVNDTDAKRIDTLLQLCKGELTKCNLEDLICLLEESETGVDFVAMRQFTNLPKVSPLLISQMGGSGTGGIELDSGLGASSSTTETTLPECLKTFIEKYGFDAEDLNAQNKHRTTPLTLAVYKNDYNLVELLLERGVDPSLANGIPRTPEQLAAKYGDNKVQQIIALALRCQLESLDFTAMHKKHLTTSPSNKID